jgi:DNA polymerase-3 subunit gamma/tau
LEQPEEKKLIENCAKEVVPGFMELKLVLSEKEEPEENRQSQSLDNGGAQQINDTVFSEPAVKKTLELFDGRVIKVNR